MKITLLGTGTSQGIPVIGCNCHTCISTDSRDRRLRSSVLIETDSTTVVIDVGPDFREQMLKNNVKDLDAVLITHEHNDHVIGLDDLRPILFRKIKNDKSENTLNIYAENRVGNEIRRRFDYGFGHSPYPGVPRFEIVEFVPYEIITIGDIDITPLRVMHGKLEIVGFKISSFAYLTDTNFIPEATLPHLQNLDILVMDALRNEPHHAHFTLSQAIEAAELIGASKTYFTHLSHLMGPTSVWEKELPPNIYASHDNLKFRL